MQQTPVIISWPKGNKDLSVQNGVRKGQNKTLVRVEPQEVASPTKLEGVSQKVFLDRYSLKDEAGSPVEQYPEQMWARVAKAIARVEKSDRERKEWGEKFYKAMEGFKFIPGGRILAGAGTGYEVTFFNCYVLPCPKDSRHGILANLGEMVEIMSRGGGVGINFSSLRPRGSRVKGVNGFSSGPVNWAGLHSIATRDIIQQGGSRRGALMVMLWDWHPDIEEFITVKQDLSMLRGANLSVCVSDRLMQAVKNDEEWPLLFPDLDDPKYKKEWEGVLESWIEKGGKVKIHKTVRARYLWDLICEAAWASAEPGVVFMERYNKWHNNYYFNKINCVNPCVTGDTKVFTSKGIKTINQLYKEGEPFTVVVDGKKYLSTPPFITGVKKVHRLITKEGYELRLTKNHKVYTLQGKREAGELKRGDKLLLSSGGAFGVSGTLEEGRVWGWLVGDGSMKKDAATLFFYQEEKKELAPQFAYMVNTLVAQEGVTNRDYILAPVYVDKEDKAVVESTRLWRIAKRLGFAHGKKHIVPAKIFEGSQELQRGFIQGLFSSDGHVAGTPEKGVSVRLTSVCKSLLTDVQRLLLNFGIPSKIYQNRRKEGNRLLPDGRGSKKLYKTKAYHDLVISGTAIHSFAKLIGFLQDKKLEKLHSLLALYTKGPYASHLTATFDYLEEEGKEEVFDITVAKVHKFSANGIIVSNCGEEGLPPYGVCNLGSLNLANFVNEKGEMDYKALAEHARVAVRFQDNVIDGDIYVLPGIVEAQLNGERRIGIGTMGLGDALIKMKLRYGTEESIAVIEKIYKTIRDAVYEESADIAAHKGAFPKFDRKKYLEGYFVKQLPEEVRRKIAKNGIRNSVLLMQAPTGSTSLMAGATSGIEPVYEFSFIRRDRLGEHRIYHPLYEAWKKEHPGKEAPDYFVSANSLTPEEHVRVQAAIQKYTDASISKTVNAPQTHTVEDVKKLYTLAYELGCKGITYMREGSRPGVLSREEEPKQQQQEEKESVGEEDNVPSQPVVFSQTQQASRVLSERPEVVSGATYRLVTPMGSAFITINEDGQGKPFEVFINIGKAGSDLTAMATALGRLISTTLRLNSGVDSKARAVKIVEQLAGIGGRRSVGFGPNKVYSLPDAVARALSRHFKIGGLNGNGGQYNQMPTSASNAASANNTTNLKAGAVMAAKTIDPTLAPADQRETPLGGADRREAGKDPFDRGETELDSAEAAFDGADICPECGAAALVWEEGCVKCYSCGHAEC